MSEQSQADLVIDRFGGIARMSELTGRPVERIRNWRRVGRIPQTDHLDLLKIARAGGIQLLPHDLVAYLITELLAAAEASDSTTPAAQADVAA